jgi:hypothetical protein
MTGARGAAGREVLAERLPFVGVEGVGGVEEEQVFALVAGHIRLSESIIAGFEPGPEGTAG